MAPIRVLRQAATRFVNHDASLLAAAISFFTFLSVAPLSLATILSLTWFVGPQRARIEVSNLAEHALGPEGSDAFQQLLVTPSLYEDAGWLALVSLAVATFGGSRAFLHMRTALNRVWGLQPRESQTMHQRILLVVRKRLLTLVLVGGVAGLTLAAVVLDAAAAAAMALVGRVVGPVPGVWTLMQSGVSWILLTSMFTLSYRVLPDARVAWRDLVLGAVVASTIVTIAGRLMGAYLTLVAARSLPAAAASVLVTMLWLHATALVYLFGAEVTATVAYERGRTIEPEAHAEITLDRTVVATPERARSSEPLGVCRTVGENLDAGS